MVVPAPFKDELNGRKLIVGACASHSGSPLMSPPVPPKVGVTDSDWTGLGRRLLRGLWT